MKRLLKEDTMYLFERMFFLQYDDVEYNVFCISLALSKHPLLKYDIGLSWCNPRACNLYLDKVCSHFIGKLKKKKIF